MVKLPQTLKGLNSLLHNTKESFEQHKEMIKATGKRYTARDRKSVNFKKQIKDIEQALVDLKEKNEKKKVERRAKKEALKIAPTEKQAKVIDLIDA